MINSQMKEYEYFVYGEVDEYGQPGMSTETKGTVKIAINLITEAIDANSLYSGAQYSGLTFDKSINSTYVIQYGAEKLKVLYANPFGRYTQVFLARM